MQTDVRETAQNAVNQGKSLLTRQLDDRTTQVGQQIGSVAQELRKVGDQLRASGPAGMAADYVDQGADIVDRVGRYLQDADTDRLVSDLEGMARRQPYAIAAGALALGFAASRFLKTSSARRYRGSADLDEYRSGGSYGSGQSYEAESRYGGTSTFGETTYGDRTGIRSGGDRYAT